MKVYLVTAPRVVYLQALMAAGFTVVMGTMADSDPLARLVLKNLADDYTPPPAMREPHGQA